jgi:HD-GYP domain-containing protein (c-di-GMP phosphodiesterase class II)
MPVDKPSVSRLSQRLSFLRDSLKTLQPDLTRIAVALYDATTGMVNTYAYSSDDESPLLHYGAQLDKLPTLKKLITGQTPRIIGDMRKLAQKASTSAHTKALVEAGYLSSFTIPILDDNELIGFVFFNSSKVDAFTRLLLPQLEITAYAVSLLIINERTELRTLKGAMRSAVEVTHQRDPETGDHLLRIASYARLITRELASNLMLSDEYIEQLVMFSSLHDIGKISIPDAILLKPGKLTEEEFEVMKTHTTRGLEIIDSLIKNHALGNLDHIEVLRNIVEGHHEFWDGSGYPHGLMGTKIPLEARIIAVADVYDALTGERPYKKRLSNETAFRIMVDMRGKKLDPQCLDAFIKNRIEVEKVRVRLTPDNAAT